MTPSPFLMWSRPSRAVVDAGLFAGAMSAAACLRLAGELKPLELLSVLLAWTPRILLGAAVFSCVARMFGLYSCHGSGIRIRKQSRLLAISLLASTIPLLLDIPLQGFSRGVMIPGIAFCFCLMLFVRIVPMNKATTSIRSKP